VSAPSPLLYGRIAELYDTSLELFGFKRSLGRALDRLVPDLPPHPRVCDAGCGTGPIAFWFLRRFAEAEVIAFDLDRKMLEVMRRTARRRTLGDRLVIAEGDLRGPGRLTGLDDGRPLSLPAGAFDVIAVGAALEHVPLRNTLAHLHRLLAPGGQLVILGVREGGAAAVLGRLFRFRPYPVREVRHALEEAGFGSVRVERLTAREFPANLTRVAGLARRSRTFEPGGGP
jgi:SAM-dependent methyltransferase